MRGHLKQFLADPGQPWACPPSALLCTTYLLFECSLLRDGRHRHLDTLLSHYLTCCTHTVFCTRAVYLLTWPRLWAVEGKSLSDLPSPGNWNLEPGTASYYKALKKLIISLLDKHTDQRMNQNANTLVPEKCSLCLPHGSYDCIWVLKIVMT